VTNLLLPALTPLALLLLPGLGFVSHQEKPLTHLTQNILWSLSLLTVSSYLAALLGFPAWPLILLITSLSLLLFIKHRGWSIFSNRYYLPLLGLLLTSYLVFSLPFISFHQALPTGDSQKAILWANEIRQTNQLPNYQQSITLLNRDPVDFFTPGLHTLTALAQTLAGEPLHVIGFFSLLASLTLPLLALAITHQLKPSIAPLALAAAGLLLLTHLRFLRYLREPGYHYQNIFGEIFLWGLLWLTLQYLHRPKFSNACLLLLSATALLLTHQFSVLIASFVLVPFLWPALRNIWLHSRRNFYLLALLILPLGLIAGTAFNAPAKIFHLVSQTPHLLNLTPSLTDYPRLLGLLFTLAALAAFIFLLSHLFRFPPRRHSLINTFLLSTALLLILSQAPRFGLDIPPVRALLYAPLPLSATIALALSFITHWRLTNILLLSLFLLSTALPSLTSAFQLSHSHPNNSTLTPGQLTLINYIKHQSPEPQAAILIDDTNRRASAWLALTGQPTFTRLTDLSRQTAEASQSELRRQLHLNQLDYTKIYDLGNNPLILELLRKHNIRWLLGVDSASTANFLHNPHLKIVASADGLTLFEVEKSTAPSAVTPWLLRTSTLANNIGDEEDTFLHLPASLSATRLSTAETDGHKTWRRTTAPLFSLNFNIATYTLPLLDQEKTTYPDTSLQFSLNSTEPTSTPLWLETPTGHQHLLLPNTPLQLKAQELPLDDQGFITLVIHNPSSQVLFIEEFALGLNPVP
jgi:hypothetical protein